MRFETLRGLILVIAQTLDGSQAQIEGNIVGGDFATIRDYPHSVFLTVLNCPQTGESWICGASILNQHFVITAGHCVEGYSRKSKMFLIFGHENRNKGDATLADNVKIHENYDDVNLNSDIALVRVQTPFTFNHKVKRVAINRNTPIKGSAYIAGWGLVDEINEIKTAQLKHINQTLWTRADCMKELGTIPLGTICAGHPRSSQFVAQGDSGSALMVRGYVQVGIVSFKNPALSNSLTVYTDVGYYYKWIAANTMRLFCNED